MSLQMLSIRTVSWWIKPSIVPFFSGVLGGLGISLMLDRASAWLLPNIPSIPRILEDFWFILPLVYASVSAWRTRRRFPRCLISNTDILVELNVGDMFKMKGAFIVGSNTTFDSSMEDGTISKDSVQGKYTEQFATNMAQLDAALDQSLNLIEHTGSHEQKSFGRKKLYKRGTVCPVELNGRKAYFISIASLNNNRVAQSTLPELLDALPVMWDGLREQGGMEELLCPILGSGFSRISAPREQIVQHLIRSFVASSREGKLTEKLSIIISHSDITRSNIDVEALRKFLEHECTYTAVPTTQVDEGTAIDTAT